VEDEVVFAAHHYGRGKASGVEVEMRNWQVCTVRDGKVVRYRVFPTRQEALEAVGLEE
jgi:ketosteroid isomerase-like protein